MRSSRKSDVKAARAQVRAYLAAQPPPARRLLRRLRAQIQTAAPAAVDHFSYRIPGFTLDGRTLVWYAGFARHASIYPIGDAIRRELSAELEGFETAKGTVRFPITDPPSAALIRKLVKARIAEIRKRPRRR